MPSSTISWMAAMIAKDEEEEFDRTLSFVEYLATFINPEGVQKVRQKRQEPQFGVDDNVFLDTLSKITGREAPALKKDK